VGLRGLAFLARARDLRLVPGRGRGSRPRAPEASLQGSRIAVDPGHGPADPGAEGPTGLREADATLLIAEELLAELQRRGAAPFLLRHRESDPSSSARANVANDLGAEVLVSLHLNSHAEAAAEGASTYYYGREGWSSQAGQRLAEMMQEVLVSRLGRKDGRTHAKSLPLLRETHMPAVQVEPCFISNPSEESLLKDGRFRRDLAQALTDAIEHFFSGPSTEAVTSENEHRTAASLGGQPE
jgi:N-acetylmuramoyl-L-alanine amidase